MPATAATRHPVLGHLQFLDHFGGTLAVRRNTIRHAVACIVRHHVEPLPFRPALKLVMAEVRLQLATHHEDRRRASIRAREVTPHERLVRADAEQLARSYRYDVDALSFEVDRRSAGSFTTTPEGSPEQRGRYFRALTVARARKVQPVLQAAE